MLPPKVLARVEQVNDHAGVRIHGGQVCALAEIAPLATPRQILKFIPAAVLFGKDMFEVKGPE